MKLIFSIILKQINVWGSLIKTDLPLNNSDVEGLENVPQHINGNQATAVSKDYGQVEGAYGDSRTPEFNPDNIVETLLSLLCGLCKGGAESDNANTPGRGGNASVGPNAANLPLIEQDIVNTSDEPGEKIKHPKRQVWKDNVYLPIYLFRVNQSSSYIFRVN